MRATGSGLRAHGSVPWRDWRSRFVLGCMRTQRPLPCRASASTEYCGHQAFPKGCQGTTNRFVKTRGAAVPGMASQGRSDFTVSDDSCAARAAPRLLGLDRAPLQDGVPMTGYYWRLQSNRAPVKISTCRNKRISARERNTMCWRYDRRDGHGNTTPVSRPSRPPDRGT